MSKKNKTSDKQQNVIALPDGWMDWNIDQVVEYLRKKYMFSSSGDAKCIYHLIELYDKHKYHYRYG